LCGQLQDFGIDAQFYTPGIASAARTWFLGISQGVTDNNRIDCQGNYQNQEQPQMNINAGFWRQYEIQFHPSTHTWGTQISNQGDGEARMWVDGQLFMHDGPGVNLNGTQSMANCDVLVGGVITSFTSGGTGDPLNDGRCTPFSLCPGLSPGAGAPTPFNRYIDDIIVMKR
jgi:hypothetical protein